MIDAKIKDALENTELTVVQIAESLNVGWKVVWNRLHGWYSKEFIMQRKQKNYARSKLGILNPMFGKTFEQHHQFKETKEDGRGYLLVLKPDWYTGRKNSRHVFAHSVVLCLALGITEVPPGFVVHHIDSNTRNNDIDNLCLVSISGHGKLHHEKKCNDYPKGVGTKGSRSANTKLTNAVA